MKELTQLLIDPDWETLGLDVQFKIAEYDDKIVLVFQGSNSVTDWNNNLMFLQVPYKDMSIPFYVHSGFLKAWKSVNDNILDRIKTYDKDKLLVITGHSFGAAMATLCYEDVWFSLPERRKTIRLITFGSPRVIGRKGFRKIRSRFKGSKRVVNPFDLVTLLPFKFMKFKHIGRTIYLRNEYKNYIKLIQNHNIKEYDRHWSKKLDGRI